ncbi:MAG: helix-turn-helix domain-containing protein [Sphaerochaetaceae bacterium]|nr:helix-turn-helix domain-containing protein [Sphaerochaetaceae bacterium]
MDNDVIEKLEKIAFHYEKSTGVRCRFVQDLDNVMKRMPMECADMEGCKACHLKAMNHSEVFGGSYIYLCPKDLMFWASPVLKNGVNIGSFIAGPVISVDPEELEIYDKIKDMNIKEISPDVAYSYSRILFMCASFMFSDFNQQLISHESGFDFQSRIVESLRDLKDNKLANGVRSAMLSLATAIKSGNEKTSKDRLSDCISICISNFGVTLSDMKGWAPILVSGMLMGSFEGNSDESSACSEALHTIKAINDSNSDEEILGLLDVQRGNFCKRISSDLMDQGLNPQIIKAIHYMQNNLANPISEFDVAKHVQLSVSHFSRLFNSTCNMSFSKYLNKLRTERAKELLIATDISILEICELTGYEDQSYFTRIFKKYQGMAPNAFRIKTGKFPNQDIEIHN